MRSGVIVTTIGVVMSVLGMAVAVICLFQPWRSCDYEDISAGCAMLPGDAAVMMAAMLAIPIGLAIVIIGVLLRHWRRVRPVSADGERAGLRWVVVILAGSITAVVLLVAGGGIGFLFSPTLDP